MKCISRVQLKSSVAKCFLNSDHSLIRCSGSGSSREVDGAALKPTTSWLCYGYWLFGEQLCLDQQRAVSICWRQMFVSVAFRKTSVQAKTAEFCIFTTYHLLARCPSLRVCLVYFLVDRWIRGLLKLLMLPRHSWLPKNMQEISDQPGNVDLLRDTRPWWSGCPRGGPTGHRSWWNRSEAWWRWRGCKWRPMQMRRRCGWTEEKSLTLSASGHTLGCFRLSFRRFLISSRVSRSFVFE